MTHQRSENRRGRHSRLHVSLRVLTGYLGFVVLSALPVCAQTKGGVTPKWEAPSKLETQTESVKTTGSKRSALTVVEGWAAENERYEEPISSVNRFLSESLFVTAAGEQAKIQEMEKILSGSAGEAGVQTLLDPPACSLQPVVGQNVAFIPFKMCSSKETRFTGVAPNGTVVGNYRVADSRYASQEDPDSWRYRAFKVQIPVACTPGQSCNFSGFHALRLNTINGFTAEGSWANGISEDGSTVTGAVCPPGPGPGANSRCECASQKFTPARDELPAYAQTQLQECSFFATRWKGLTSRPALLEKFEPAVRGTVPQSSDLIQSEGVALTADGSVVVGSNLEYEPIGGQTKWNTRPVKWASFSGASSEGRTSQVPLPDHSLLLPQGGTASCGSPPTCNFPCKLNGQGNACIPRKACADRDDSVNNFCQASARAISRDGAVVSGSYKELFALGIAGPWGEVDSNRQPITSVSASRSIWGFRLRFSTGGPAFRLSRMSSSAGSPFFTLERPQMMVYGMSPDGWATVGKDSNGTESIFSKTPGYSPGFSTLAPEGIAGGALFFGVPTDRAANRCCTTAGERIFAGTGCGSCSTGNSLDVVQNDEAFRWRQNQLYSDQGTIIGLGEIYDEYRIPGASNFIDSRGRATSAGGCRTVGNSYGGIEGGVDNTGFFRTASIRPGLGGELGMHRLKDEVNDSLAITNPSLNVDVNNTGGAIWQMIEANGITADGRLIVGSAKCHLPGMPDDGDVYGYVVQVKNCCGIQTVSNVR